MTKSKYLFTNKRICARLKFKKRWVEHVLSSNSPVPGGGGAASLSASLGCALGSMTANLTLGKEKFKLYEEDIKPIIWAL